MKYLLLLLLLFRDTQLFFENNRSFSIKSIILDPNEHLKIVERYEKNSNILITNKKFINEIIIVCKTGEQKDRSKNSNGK